MKENWFFEIPIYRYTPEKFSQECEKKMQRHKEWLYETSAIPQANAPKVYRLAEERIRAEHGHWQYNQIVGWLRLLAMRSQLQGEYYFVDAKRITKNVGSKQMVWQGKAFEVHIDPEQSSADIFDELCEALNHLQKEKPFKGHFLNMELFLNIGPYVDWRALIQQA